MESRRPSAVWYWVGGGVAVLSVVLAVVWIATAVISYADRIDDLQRVDVPGEGTVRLTGTGGYTIYYEAPGAAEGPLPPVMVSVAEADSGQRVPLEDYDGSFTYTFGNREGRAVLTFSITEAGAYNVRTVSEGPGRGDVAIGRSLSPASFGIAIAASIILVIIGLAAAALIITLTAVKRHRARGLRR